MFKKTFADTLKENLTKDSFKHTKQHNQILNDPFLCELFKCYISIKDIEKIYNSQNFYKKMFRQPVRLLFYWCEEDWQGRLFVIYSYKHKYIYTNSYFGSCEGCDSFPNTEESLIKKFNSLNICDNINNINIHGYDPKYTNPDLVKNFEKFKRIYNKNRPFDSLVIV